MNILKQKTESLDIKRYAVEHMEKCGSFAYTRKVLEELKNEVIQEVNKLGGHEQLEKLVEYLHNQVRKTGTELPPSPPLKPLSTSQAATSSTTSSSGASFPQPEEDFPRVDSI